ncbi:MAG: hypothetical protein HY398_02400 [Candidatus Doudnabacteria bacterium]|nr:hypothetical protein [Candidatus Doudnabacteria bacterium]
MNNLRLKITSGVLAAYLFSVSLWGFEDFRYYLLAAAIALAAVAFSNRKRGRQMILPLLLVIGYFGSLAAISWLPGKILLGLLVAMLYYLYRLAPAADEPATLATGFLLLWFIWSWHFFFPLAWYNLLLLIFASFFLLYTAIFHDLLVSLVAALAMVEVAWAEAYWPVHFLTAAVMSFAVFYAISVGSREYFSGRLTRKKLYFQAGLILIVLTLTLFSSPWLP